LCAARGNTHTTNVIFLQITQTFSFFNWESNFTWAQTLIFDFFFISFSNFCNFLHPIGVRIYCIF
jgi:hypothetical protein